MPKGSWVVRLGIVNLTSKQAGHGGIWVNFQILVSLVKFQRARALAGLEFAAHLPTGNYDAGAFDSDGNYYTGTDRALIRASPVNRVVSATISLKKSLLSDM